MNLVSKYLEEGYILGFSTISERDKPGMIDVSVYTATDRFVPVFKVIEAVPYEWLEEAMQTYKGKVYTFIEKDKDGKGIPVNKYITLNPVSVEWVK